MFTTSVQADLYPKYSKLRHRLRARHVTSSPTFQSPYQTIYFPTPYYVVYNPEATFIEVLVGMRLDFSFNSLILLLLIVNDADTCPRSTAMFENLCMDMHRTESQAITRCRKSIHVSPDVNDDISTV